MVKIFYVTSTTKALEALKKAKKGDIIHMDDKGEDKVEEIDIIHMDDKGEDKVEEIKGGQKWPKRTNRQ